MKVYWSIDELPEEPLEPVCTMGNMDGVHRGHQVILSKVRQEAVRVGAPSMAIIFDPHTRKVVRPGDDFRPLSTTREKLRRLWDLEIDHALVLPFADGISELSAAEFVDEILWEPLRIHSIYVGADAAFGKDRHGDFRFLSSEGRRLGYHAGVVDDLIIGGWRASSSGVRKAIAAGNLEFANRMLGRDHTVTGTVVRGFRRGRKLGYPTANLSNEGIALPPNGVYACWAEVEEGTRYGAMLNIGNRPTFDGRDLSIEAHLFGFDGDLYGQELRVSVRQHLRGEIAFDSPEQLKKQLRKDALEARKILGVSVKTPRKSK